MRHKMTKLIPTTTAIVLTFALLLSFCGCEFHKATKIKNGLTWDLVEFIWIFYGVSIPTDQAEFVEGANVPGAWGDQTNVVVVFKLPLNPDCTDEESIIDYVSKTLKLTKNRCYKTTGKSFYDKYGGKMKYRFDMNESASEVSFRMEKDYFLIRFVGYDAKQKFP